MRATLQSRDQTAWPVLTDFGRHGNTVAKRDICQPKHEGGYKRILHRVFLLTGYDKTGKSLQAGGGMNATTCTESKNKKCQICNGNLWSCGRIYKYSREKRARTICKLKHNKGVINKWCTEFYKAKQETLFVSQSSSQVNPSFLK